MIVMDVCLGSRKKGSNLFKKRYGGTMWNESKKNIINIILAVPIILRNFAFDLI